MSRFTCNQALSNEGSWASCLCAICGEVLRTSLAAERREDIAETADDVPGNTSSGYSLTIGTPITGVLEVNGDHDWYAVKLVAGTRYQITLNGVAVDGYGALEAPYVYLRSASGGLIAQNDDIRNGVIRNSRINWVATASGQYLLDAGAWDERFVGGYQLSIIEFTPPTYTLDEIADFLTTGFCGDGGRR